MQPLRRYVFQTPNLDQDKVPTKEDSQIVNDFDFLIIITKTFMVLFDYINHLFRHAIFAT